jgi:type II secretory pathway pseudopilin PulG
MQIPVRSCSLPTVKAAFAFPDLLMVMAAVSLLAAIALPIWSSNRAQARLSVCKAHLKDVNRAVLQFSDSNGGRLPDNEPGMKGGVWWWYKEQVKGELEMRNPSSPADKVFACPSDRGYEEGRPFRLSSRFDYGSYVFNGVNLPGLPHIAGANVASIREPTRTLLMMEWSAHAPLSWHRSRTGKKNHPFYNNAENVVGFVDGHIDFIPIYYDGINPAYTRDPIPGYKYKYSGD